MAWNERKLREELEGIFGDLQVDDRCSCDSCRRPGEKYTPIESAIDDSHIGRHGMYAPPWLADDPGPKTLGGWAKQLQAWKKKRAFLRVLDFVVAK